MDVRWCIMAVMMTCSAPPVGGSADCTLDEGVGSANRTLRERVCAGVCIHSPVCQDAIRALLIQYGTIAESRGGNVSEGSARWVIDAARGVPDSEHLLETFAQNESSVGAPARGVLLALYGVLIVVGTCGNALVVLSVVRKPAMRTARNMFILNLAVSDTLVCTVVSPLTLLELLTKHWPLPDSPFLCKATGTIQAVSIFASTITITAIALDRYQLIVYPTRNSLKTMGAVVTLVCIWLIAAALASPLFIYRSLIVYTLGHEYVDSVSFCIEDWPIDNGRALYSLFSLIFQYLLPVLVVVGSHVQIHRKLLGRQVARRTRNRTPAILMAIAVTYVISWLPLNVFNLVADYSSEPILEEQKMLVTYAVCHMCGMSSACSNPFLYGWLNENFRKEFKEMLCNKKTLEKRKRCKQGQNQRETELTALGAFDQTPSISKTSQVF